jgi:translation initiation factor IF-2
MAVLDDTRRSTGARGGFVSAFVRAMRRGPQSSAVGKVAVGALVIVLSAGSVVGMSVLLRGTGKSTAPASALAGGAGTGAGNGSVLVSPSPSGKARSSAKPAANSPRTVIVPAPHPSRSTRSAAPPKPAAKVVTYTNVAGLGCTVNGASYVETGWYQNGDAGWWTLGSGSFAGNGCDGRFTDMPMSGTESDTAGQSIVWGFQVGSAAQSCKLSLFVPTSSSARDVAAKSAHIAVIHGTTAGHSTYVSPGGDRVINQSAYHSRWVDLGTYPVHNGAIGAELTNRGSTSGYDMTYPHLAGGAVRISCVKE